MFAMFNQRNDDETLLQTAMLAAKVAGELLANQFARPQHCKSKPDSSIVSEADIAAELQIRDLIAARHPDHGFIGEETGRTERPSPFTWVVDPLDGTKSFLRGIPLFSVEIALLKNGVPHIGVSSLPMMGEMLWAIRGKGAHSDKGKFHVSETSRLDSAYISFGNIKHFDRIGRLGNLLSLVTAASQSRGIGDSWSYHLLVRGSIDIFADAWTEFWDIAAHIVIVEEAGGMITDLNGGVICENSNSVLATNSILHQTVCAYFSR